MGEVALHKTKTTTTTKTVIKLITFLCLLSNLLYPSTAFFLQKLPELLLSSTSF